MGNGGTAGTTGSATVGTAGTAGTCGKEGTAGTGTAGGVRSATFLTADTTGAATESTTLFTADGTTPGTKPGTTPGITPGTTPGVGVSTAAIPTVGAADSPCVLVSWPTVFPLVSTVAMISTLTVKTSVAAPACRRWKSRWSLVMADRRLSLSFCGGEDDLS